MTTAITVSTGASSMESTDLRPLGRTGVSLTQLGQGTARLGDLFVKHDEPGATGVIDAAWEAGVRFYDTAPFYGLGQSGQRCGCALFRRPREEFVLQTKVGPYLVPPAPGRVPRPKIRKHGLPFNIDFDYSYDGIMRSVEQSPARLGISRIDTLVIHDLDLGYHVHEVNVAAQLAQLRTSGSVAVAALRDQGVIRGFGAGINEREMIPRLLDAVDLDFFLVAMPCTLLDQDVLDRSSALFSHRAFLRRGPCRERPTPISRRKRRSLKKFDGSRPCARGTTSRGGRGDTISLSASARCVANSRRG